ncbi:MAG TPA: metallophosphoesterase [Polyangia bacterium]
MFRLAHVTDPHFRPRAGTFAGAGVGDFLGKRAVGAVNLVVNRRRKHRMELLEALRADLNARAPDHVAVTGDLGNISIESEWLEARRWLTELALPADAVTVIPGNHDAYVEDVVARRGFETMFEAYQTADLRVGQDHYPFVRVRGDLALIAVNTCVPTGDLGAWGEIGEAQLARLEALLTSPALANKLRVVLLHHPPVMVKPPESRNLRDREALAAVIGRAGASLILHGHDHRDERATLPGPRGAPVPIVGAGSASYAGAAESRSRYNIYEIAGHGITAVTYVHDEAKDAFVEVRREPLSA